MAPAKSLNFATHIKVKRWLKDKVWKHTGTVIKVVDDLRYLGAHVTTTYDVYSGTLEARIDKAIQQLRRLRFCPVWGRSKGKSYSGEDLCRSTLRSRGREADTPESGQSELGRG